MAKDNRSFFEKLTGAVRLDEYDDNEVISPVPANTFQPRANSHTDWPAEEVEEGELSVDVYQTDTDIIVKTMVAGVKPDDLDVSITRDMVTIKGKREVERVVDEDNYFHKELYWGSFSRAIVLPQEIDVDAAEAIEKHGLLIIKLPKLNKNRQTKVKVRG